VFNQTDSIITFNHSKSITGLSICAEIVQKSPNSMVRFVLQDTEGNEYLVGESNRMLNDIDSVQWENYSEETCKLSDIYPAKLKIAIKDATVILHKIQMSESGASIVNTLSYSDAESHHRQQIEQKVAAINTYNQKHNKLWVAGVTEISLKPYAQKKFILGLTDEEFDTKCFEYYAGGIYEVGEQAATTYENPQTDESPYIDNFDWRNRHGINWMTSCKDQKGSGMCTSFAIAGVLESLVNLYYNKKYDLDLSEVDIAYYGTGRSYKKAYTSGIWSSDILPNLVEHGVSDEESIPFIDSPEYDYPKDRPQAKERIHFQSCDNVLHFRLRDSVYISLTRYISLTKIDSIKKHLIQKGPMVSGFNNGYGLVHSMTLVGYKRLQAGDSIYIVNNHHSTIAYRIQENDPRIGKTYWLFKNSYGTNSGPENDGYYNILFHTDYNMFLPYYINTPIRSNNYTEADIQCTDNDGDGYFYWGIGEKPTNLPSWAQEEPDGDDSDYSKGPMNEYGYCMDLTPNENDTIFITNNTVWDRRQFLYQHVVICDNASLTVTDKTTFYKGCNMFIRENGRLIVDGGELSDVTLLPQAASSILVKNGGLINFNDESFFYLPLNSKMEINNGTLQ